MNREKQTKTTEWDPYSVRKASATELNLLQKSIGLAHCLYQSGKRSAAWRREQLVALRGEGLEPGIRCLIFPYIITTITTTTTPPWLWLWH